MSTPVQKPAFAAGINGSSGSVQTGQLTFVRGGGRSYSVYSGNGADTLVYSGAGRVDTFVMHQQLSSGQSAFCYDAAVVISGGPYPTSGHKLLFATPPTWAGGVASTSGSALTFNSAPVNIGMPFQSGLCISARSGCPGFTISFTPEVDGNFVGL